MGGAFVLVEDDPDIGEGLSRALVGHGYTTSWVTTGGAALDLVRPDAREPVRADQDPGRAGERTAPEAVRAGQGCRADHDAAWSGISLRGAAGAGGACGALGSSRLNTWWGWACRITSRPPSASARLRAKLPHAVGVVAGNYQFRGGRGHEATSERASGLRGVLGGRPTGGGSWWPGSTPARSRCSTWRTRLSRPLRQPRCGIRRLVRPTPT